MDVSTIKYQRVLPETLRGSAAALYDEAFGSKLSIAIRSTEKRLAIIDASILPEFAMVALAGEQLAGLAGFHTAGGSFTGGLLSGKTAYDALSAELGHLGAARAALIFSLYERIPEPGELLMDGIAVRKGFRGMGIGSVLLDRVAGYAARQGCTQVRLDVIDTNPRARKLYERKGFKATKTSRFPYLRWLLGFGAATTMVREVTE